MKNSFLYKKIILFCILCIAVCGLSSCGYTTKTMLPDNSKSIYIPIFKNETYKPSKSSKTFKRDIENIITDDVVSAFLKDAGLRVTNRDDADLMLEGAVIYYSKTPLRYSSADMDTVDEYRVTVSVNLKLTDLNTTKVIWENEVITRTDDYYVAGASMSSEDSALAQASVDLAKDVLIQVVEPW